MDIVRQIRDGVISEAEADSIFDEAIQSIHAGESDPDWREQFELSNHEATAVTLGASLHDLVLFRYNGWPESCGRCGLPLDYLAYGWKVVRQPDGTLDLEHLSCPGTS
jgi:hypothetical protein